ncbi:MAG: GAF domain-containing protein [Alphaproteobacteria bacterium]
MSTLVDDRVGELERENAELRRLLAERTAQRDEALEQQTATAEVLQVINASPGDLAPVFDKLVETAARLCGNASAHLALRDGDSYRYVATRSLDADWDAHIRNRKFVLDRGTCTGRTLLERRPIHVPDLAADPEHKHPEIVTVGGLRAFLGVPLLRDSEAMGVLALARQQVGPFTEHQIALLRTFADQAVIAIENARLLNETREALEQQTATAEVLQVINSSPGDLAPVFYTILEKALQRCDPAFGMVWRHADGLFEIVAHRGAPKSFLRARSGPHRPSSPDTVLGQISAGKDIVYYVRSESDPLYLSGDPHRITAVASEVPFSVTLALRKDNSLLGAITVFRLEPRPFSDKEIALLENFAAQAVIAMENARLLGELRARTEEVAAWNRELEDRVAAQLGELERVGKLKRFLAPQLAELIVARGDENILETHRRDIVVVFCDLRGFTAFAETAEPEEVLDLLREYHGALGPIVAASEGTLDHFSGDGIMVFFNDPVPVPDASERAVRMAIEMREAAKRLQAGWRRQGRAIGFGVGIARGYATLGQIGFAERVDYTAIGTVCNLAARLCAEAGDGQILVSRRVAAAVEDIVRLEEVGDLALKGLMQAVAVYNVAAE